VKSKRFSDVLRDARAGDHDAVMAILSRYMPLINKHSAVDGALDEDMRQYILTRVVQQLPKFDPSP